MNQEKAGWNSKAARPTHLRGIMPYKDPEMNREKVRRHRKKNLTKYAARQKKYYVEHPEIYLLNACKQRAKKNGLPFNLTKEDFVIPDVCPVFGTPFERGVKSFHDNAPSCDRIRPELGYVKGNVAIISFRANRMKQQATSAELFRLAEWLQEMETQQ